MSNEKNPGCLGFTGDYTTQYMGILLSQYKDPSKPTSISWKVGLGYFCSPNGEVDCRGCLFFVAKKTVC